jgi:hypothetical protein
MVFMALTDPETRLTRTLARITPPIELPTVYWGAAAFCCLATIYILFFAIKMLYGIRYVELCPTGAFVPSATLSMSPITIPYRSIRNIQIISIKKQKTAIISSDISESRFSAQYFSTPSDFATFMSALEQRFHY